MNKRSFKESDIEFIFGNNWVVRKYDEHAYFKMLSGHGLKGVDFIGIYKSEQLFLIEIKNYHKRSYSPVDPDLSDIEGRNPILGRKLYGKIEDTLRLIRIVNKYLTTRWWFTIAHTFRKILKRRAIQKDWHFWTRVGELSKDAKNVLPVLWLETGIKSSELHAQASDELVTSVQNEYAKGKPLNIQALQITSIKSQSEKEVLKDLIALRKE